MQSSMLKVLSIPVFSLLLSACGGGGSDRVTPDRISKYNGDWQTVCSYDSETQLSSIDTLYITDTEYTFFTDVFDNNDCFGNSDYTTEIEGFLYYGENKRFASDFCNNTIEVDFTTAAIFEDGNQIPASEISSYLDLPTNTSYNLMCTKNGRLYLGDLSLDNGTSEETRPLSLDYNRPFIAY